MIIVWVAIPYFWVYLRPREQSHRAGREDGHREVVVRECDAELQHEARPVAAPREPLPAACPNPKNTVSTLALIMGGKAVP